MSAHPYKDGFNTGGEDPREIRDYVKSFYDSTYASSSPDLQCQPARKKSKLFATMFGVESSSISISELDTYLDEPVMKKICWNIGEFKLISSPRTFISFSQWHECL